MSTVTLKPNPKPATRSEDRTSCFAEWSSEDVADFLAELGELGGPGFSELVVRAMRDKINGRKFMLISDEQLSDLGITDGVQDILKLSKQILTAATAIGKVVNDPIHGHIELHPLMVKIIDTPQFQRLRNIKQLGGVYYVFPGACHNRFEYSIGVSHLAGELVELLQKKQPELGITERDVLCVRIAGLCRSLGHGPFSYMFKTMFMPCVLSDRTRQWRQEEASVAMFDHLLKVNGLRLQLRVHGLTKRDEDFIREQIEGPRQADYHGRPTEKSFLYEVVANRRNGIDVKTWDFLARDCYYLGIPNCFDSRRYMKFARVMDVNDQRQICTREKEAPNLYEMFHMLSVLHRNAYQHKTSTAIELMFTEALIEAKDHLFLPGEDGPVRMSEAIKNDDMYAYTRLTDCTFHQILISTDENLKKARELLLKVQRREHYRCIGQTPIILQDAKRLEKFDEPKIAEEIVSSLTQFDGVPLTMQDIQVHIVTYDYGKESENPIDHMRFYCKKDLQKPIKLEKEKVSQMLPQVFMEQHVRVYWKNPSRVLPDWEELEKCIKRWCTKEGIAEEGVSDTAAATSQH